MSRSVYLFDSCTVEDVTSDHRIVDWSTRKREIVSPGLQDLIFWGRDENRRSVCVRVRDCQHSIFFLAPEPVWSEAQTTQLRNAIRGIVMKRQNLESVSVLESINAITIKRLRLHGYTPNSDTVIVMNCRYECTANTIKEALKWPIYIHKKKYQLTMVNKIFDRSHAVMAKQRFSYFWTVLNNCKVVENDRISLCDEELFITMEDICSHSDPPTIPIEQLLTVCAFDIECFSPKRKDGTRGFTDMQDCTHVPFIISMCTFRDDEDLDDALIAAIPHYTEDTFVSGVDAEQIYCEDPIDMIEVFAGRIRHLDVDIITGYNINTYDSPYLFNHPTQQGIPFPHIHKFRVRPDIMNETEDSEGLRMNRWDMDMQKLHAKMGAGVKWPSYGRAVIDMLSFVQQIYRGEPSYKLGKIGEKYLGDTKDDVDYQQIFVAYDACLSASSPEEIEAAMKLMDPVIRYAMKDSVLVRSGFRKFQIIGYLSALSNETHSTLEGAGKGLVMEFWRNLLFVEESANRYLKEVDWLPFDAANQTTHGGLVGRIKPPGKTYDLLISHENEIEEEFDTLLKIDSDDEECIETPVNGPDVISDDMSKIIYTDRPAFSKICCIMDFSSQYPSGMREKNICVTTILPRSEAHKYKHVELTYQVPTITKTKKTKEAMNVPIIKWTESKKDEPEKEKSKPTEKQKGKRKASETEEKNRVMVENKKKSGVFTTYMSKLQLETRKEYVIHPEIYEGVLPRLLKKFAAKRKGFKNQMKSMSDKKSKEYAALDFKQAATKVVMNSGYGVIAAKVGAVLTNRVVSNLITGNARYSLQKVMHYLWTEKGIKICYFDTDSVMFEITKEEAIDPTHLKKLAKEISDALFIQPTVLEFQEVCYFYIVASKIYFKLPVLPNGEPDFENMVSMGGIQKRRDTSRYQCHVVDVLMPILIRGEPLKDLVFKVVELMDELMDDTVSPEDLAFTKRFNEKSTGGQMYDFCHKIISSGTPINSGEEITFVIVNNGESSITERMMLLTEYKHARENGKQIVLDKAYYMQSLRRMDAYIHVVHNEALTNIDFKYIGKDGYLFDGVSKALLNKKWRKIRDNILQSIETYENDMKE
eukprot:Lithocolla_globosa_v1_NODE_3_length_14236_cov_22.745998.p1 type:complete len:1095 gc:universal NODE_3_length_14236_cov_22.745998:719-4003(+)